MSKKRPGRKSSTRPAAKSSARPKRRPRRRAVGALALIIATAAATSIVAAQGGLGALVSAPSALRKLAARATFKSTSPLQTPTPPPLTKEYIYAGGKLIATEEPTGPVPHINSIDPGSANPGDSIGQINISGTNLATVNSIATDNALLRASFSSASATSVTGSLSIDPLCPSGNHSIWVRTRGGQRSDNSATFLVNAPAGGPTITSLSPAQARPGDSFTLSVSGTGLATVNQVSFTTSGGQPAGGITVTNVIPLSGSGGTVVTANVAISSSTAVASYNVSVSTPTQSSGSLQFMVQAANPGGSVPTPSITSINPTSVLINTSFNLRVVGSNFQSNSQIFLGNQAQLATQFVSQFELDLPNQSFNFAQFISVTVETPISGFLPATSNSMTLEIDNPVPSITTISPSAVSAGGALFTLTVNGSGFIPGNGAVSVVKVNGASRSTTDNATNMITAQIPASDINLPGGGTLSITVFNGGPGGGTSSAQTLTVVAAPVISVISPSSVTAGTGQFTLAVTGSNYRIHDVVKANTTALATSFTDLGHLSATVPASVIASGATVAITVSDPDPGGGTAAPATLTVNNPLPVITGLSPSSVVQGVTGPLGISGSGFVPTSQISINNVSHPLTFTSGSQISTQLTAQDVQSVAGLAVTVTNPTPAGGTSNSFTLNVIPPPPLAPSNLTATAVSSSQVNLAWTDNSNNETGFIIQRKTGPGGTYSTLATVSANTTVYSDGGLTSGTAYFYKVQAINNGSNSTFSNEFSAIPYSAPPSTLTGVSATAVSTSQINLAWTDSNTTEIGIKVERATASTGPFSQIAVLCPNSQAYQDTSLASSTAYYYRLRSYNSAGDGPYSSVASATTQAATPPAAPSNLTATAQVGLQIALSWFNNSTTQTAVLIERKNGNTGFTQIAQVAGTATSYTDPGPLDPVTPYCYQVRSTNGSLNSAYSNTSCATTGSSMVEIPGSTPLAIPGAILRAARLQRTLYAQLAAFNLQPSTPDTPLALIDNGAGYSVVEYEPMQGSAPAAPAGLVAWPVSSSQVNLSWVPGDATQTSFSLQRATASAGPFTEIAKILCAATVTYADTGLANSTTYYYKIQSSNGNGSSAFSNIANCTTPATPTITSVSPTYVLAGTAPFSLTVNGSNFVSGANASVVNVSGSPRTTTFVNSGQLTAALTNGDLGSVAALAITVVNPNPNQTSNAVTLNVVANSTPTITSLSPPNVLVGSAAFTLTVNGANYVSASTVLVNGAARTTTFIAPGQLTAAIPASDLTTAANLSITVANPAPGTTSAVSTFSVNNPVPSTSSISPNSVTVGGAAFTLTVNGGNFVATSVVKVGASSRTTTFVNSGQVTASIPASDIATTGSLTITVFNPAPGGGTSNSQTLTVNPNTPPAPTNLTATAISSNEIDLSWSYSGPSITGFKIFQNQGNGYSPSPLATVGPGVTTYQDMSVSSGQRYCYKVQAYSSAGNSPNSNEACASAP